MTHRACALIVPLGDPLTRMCDIPRLSGSENEPEYSAYVVALDQLPKVGASATRALEAAGYTSLSAVRSLSAIPNRATLHRGSRRTSRLVPAGPPGPNLAALEGEAAPETGAT